MVSQTRPRASSRDRLLAAAAEEFAARGFDGAKVDRIAARARVNKAMLYYHFTNKAALYRDILRHLFASVAAAVAAVREAGGAPDVQLRGFVEAIARNAVARPHFPAMWLREVAEGGRHIDDSIVLEMRQVLQTLAAILDDGRRAGVFRAVHPLVTQVSIVAPLLFFAATAPMRERYAHLVTREAAAVPLDDIIAHVQASAFAAVAVNGTPPHPPSRRRQRT